MSIVTRIAFQKEAVISALKVSFIVGIILNLINQADILFSLQFLRLNAFKVLLTFLVPYLVTIYSTTKTKLAFKIGEIAAISAKLHCEKCNETHTHVHKDDKIPVCPKCMENTNWKVQKIKELNLMN